MVERRSARAFAPHTSRLLLTISELDRMRVLPREMESPKGSFREGTGGILTSFQLEERAPPRDI